RALAHLQSLRAHSGCLGPLHLRLLQVLPTHAGFGSGTQLALALGRAFCRCHAIEVETATIAQWLSRGRRSGIGISGFDLGGLLLDGGPGKNNGVAPLLSRLALPDAWRVLVVQDPTRQGLSGARELQAIGTLPPMPQDAAADLCHQVLMRLLPGAADADFEAFAAGLNRMQRLLGAHFAAAQGGSAYTSAAVGQLLQWLAEAYPGQVAVGQSSWGPTGFAVVPDAATAQALVQTAQAAGLLQPDLLLKVVRPRNHGALIDP
ncbi:MAG: beta-ribofuranosylaminobenzene 5'-phosphate synthase, partial [Rubrivivax sp.]